MSNELRIREILRRGADAKRAGKTQEAIRNYFAILRLDPENLEANHNLGLLHVNIGKPEQAVSFFKNALLYHPKTEQIWINLRKH